MKLDIKSLKEELEKYNTNYVKCGKQAALVKSFDDILNNKKTICVLKEGHVGVCSDVQESFWPGYDVLLELIENYRCGKILDVGNEDGVAFYGTCTRRPHHDGECLVQPKDLADEPLDSENK